MERFIHYTQSAAAIVLTDAFFEMTHHLDPEVQAPDWREGEAEDWMAAILKGARLSYRFNTKGKPYPVLVEVV